MTQNPTTNGVRKRTHALREDRQMISTLAGVYDLTYLCPPAARQDPAHDGSAATSRPPDV